MPKLFATRTAVALGVAGVGVATALVGIPSSAAATCSDVEVIFARGTGEAPGLGIVGRPLVSGIQSALPGRTVTSYAVDYPAAYSQNAGPGATDMTNRVTSVAAQCANTRFVIGGYSQGATVTDLAVGIRTGVSTGSSIPTSLAPRVAAVVVFGNPLGLSGRTIASAAPLYADRAKDYCNSSDSVCGGGTTGTGGHLSYVTNGSVADGARFAAALISRTPSPSPTATTTTSPTSPVCVTATAAEHVTAGRAYRLVWTAYARGSNDRIGLVSSSTPVSLERTSSSRWDVVGSC